MRKVIMFNMVSLDGFFEGLNREIDWHVVDEEFNQLSINQLKSFGTILFGRATYQMMASYWPSPVGLDDDPIVAGLMNEIPKIVFSNTLKAADWNNSRLVRGDACDEIRKLKELPGKDMVIFGSAHLVASLAENGLIDQYRVIVNPVVLGQGRSLFGGLTERLHLKLLDAKSFTSGNVLLTYQAENGELK